jgi:hypothetical protein
MVRKTLECFIQRIKLLMEKHQSLSSLSIGNLKHRTLRGDVISSQKAHQEPLLKRKRLSKMKENKIEQEMKPISATYVSSSSEDDSVDGERMIKVNDDDDDDLSSSNSTVL